MPNYSAYLVVVSNPLVITLIVCYMVRMVVFLAASTVAMHTENENRREACLKLAEMTCRWWPWRHPPTGPLK
jgi:hypothetical protein